MPTITLRRHSGGIDRSAERFEIQDGKYVSLDNLWPTEEALKSRPGRTRYLTQISPNLPGAAIERFYHGAATGAPVASQGPRAGSTFANDATFGSLLWANPGNAGASDDVYTEPPVVTGSSENTQYLRAQGFGFTIPTGVTIRGIQVDIERKEFVAGGAPPDPDRPLEGVSGNPNITIRDASIRLTKTGSAIGTDKAATTTDWPQGSVGAADRYANYGSQTDLWGTTWTPAEINAATFGVLISALVFPNSRAQIDFVRITIYYDPAPAADRETLLFVGSTLYSDKTGAWAGINGANVLKDDADLEILVWKGKAFIQDGENGPYTYDGTTFAVWTGANPPPKAKFMLFDQERIYAAGIQNDLGGAVRASTLDNENDWPPQPKPAGDEGVLMYAGRNDGDFITGLGRLGSMKLIFKRARAYRLTGDNADTWDLTPQPIFPYGCIAHRTIAECGNVTCWTDGRRVYAFNGQSVDPDFGKEIEPLLALTPKEKWPQRCAVFWPEEGAYILWYTPITAVIHDFRTKAWYGPWYTLPAREAVVDRDTGVIWVAHSIAGEAWQLDQNVTTDDGLPIAWMAESKHYDLGQGTMVRPRQLFVTADGAKGTLRVDVISSGGAGQTADRIITRTMAFSGSGIQTKKTPMSPGADGVYLGIKIVGPHALGKVYEYGLRADPLRQRTA